jgi:hypothetical protein
MEKLMIKHGCRIPTLHSRVADATAVALSFTLSLLLGCAATTDLSPSTQSNPERKLLLSTTPSNASVEQPKKNILLFNSKAPSKLTGTEKHLLAENGYSSGIWASDCGRQQISSIRYYDDGDQYIAEVTEFSKTKQRLAFYQVTEVVPRVIQFKQRGVDLISGNTFVKGVRSGFKNSRVLIFDSTTLFADGPQAGIATVQVKDGFILGSTDTTGKPVQAPILTKCR